MTLPLWMILLINLLSRATTIPLPYASSLPTSMYDICTTADLHQIEELKETLFEHLNRSSSNFDENKASASFGLLDEDWKRLLILENRIPEGSVLKSRLLVVFRILIAALYQAHGTTFDQDNNLVSDEELNSNYFGEESTSSELEFGESKNENVVLYRSDFNSRVTTLRNLPSNEVSRYPNSRDKTFEMPQIFDYTDSKDTSESTDDTLSTTQIEYESNLIPSTHGPKNTTSLNSNASKSMEYFEWNSENSVITSTHSKGTSASNPNATIVLSSATIETEPNTNEDFTKVNDMTNSPVVARGRAKEQNNGTTTENYHLQNIQDKISSKYLSIMNHTASTVDINVISLTDNVTSLGESANITPDILTVTCEDMGDTTKSLVDTTESALYPELIKLLREKERANIENHVEKTARNFEDTLKVLATTASSWETTRILEDIDGSDSFINEIVEANAKTESELKEETGDGVTEENTEAFKNRAHYLNNYPEESNHQSNWQQGKSNALDTSKNNDGIDDLKSTTPGDLHRSPQDSIVTTTAEKTTIADHTHENQTPYRSITISNDDVSSEDSSKIEESTSSKIEESTTVYLYRTPLNQTKTNVSQLTDNKNKNQNFLLINTPISHYIYDTKTRTTGTTATTLNLSDSGTNNFITQTNTIKDLGAHRLPPHDDSDVSSENQTSLIIAQDSLASTSTDISLSWPVDARHTAFEAPQDLEENLENHDSNEKEDESPSSSERNFFRPTNTNGASLAVHLTTKSSKHVLSTENDRLQSSSDEIRVFSLTNDDEASPTIQSLPESSDHLSSVENSSFQSRSFERNIVIPTNNDDASVAVQSIPKSSERMSSAENDSLQSSSLERHIFSPTDNDDSRIAVKPIPQGSERLSSVENDSFQSSSEEKNDFAPIDDDDETPAEEFIPESSELMSSLEKNRFHSSSLERNTLNATNNDNAIAAVQLVPENSEHTSNVENNGLQNTSGRVEKNGVVQTDVDDDYDAGPAVQSISKNSEHTMSLENDSLQSSSLEMNDLNPTNNGDATPAVQLIPENSEQILSMENDSSRRSSAEKNVFVPPDNDDNDVHDASPAVQSISKSSEHISSVENDSLQSSSLERNVFNPANNNDASLVVQSNPKSSEHTLSLENDSLQSSNLEMNDLNPINNGDASPAVQLIPENSEQISSMENDSSRRSSAEKNVFVPPDNDDNDVHDASPAVQSISKSSEHISSVENDSMQSSSLERNVFNPTNNNDASLVVQSNPKSSEHTLRAENNNNTRTKAKDKLKGMSEDSKENQAVVTEHADLNHPGSSNIHATDDHEYYDKNEESVFDQNVTNLPPKVDKALPVTEQGTFRTFSVLPSNPLDNHSPSQTYNELKIYPAHQHPYKPSSFLSRKGCRNRNGCVHVKNIEYRSNENPFSSRPTKHFSSRFKPKSRESSETEEDVSTYFVSQPEDRIWQDKVRQIKESVDDKLFHLAEET